MTFCLIKKNTFDKAIDDFMHVMYFIHQFSFVFSASSVCHNIYFVKKLTLLIMVVSFFFIILCDLYYIFRGSFDKYEIAIYFVLGIILIVSFYNYRKTMVIANLIAVSAFKNSDWKKTLKVYLYATICGFCLNALLGVITPYNGDELNVYRYGAVRTRYGIGFFFASIVQFYYLAIVMAYVLLHNKLSIFQNVIIFSINLFLFILTDTKAPFAYGILLLFLINFFYNYQDNIIYRFFGYLTIISFPLFFIIFYLLSLFYDQNNKVFYVLNRIVNHRLEYTHNAIFDFGFKLFGQNVPIINGPPNHVDSSAISMLILNGLLVFIISVIFMMYFSYISYKIKNIALLVILFCIALRSTFDCGFMAMQFSPVIFMFYPSLKKYLQIKAS